MTNSHAVSMQELEMESAELLPGRETLCVTSCHPWGGGHWGFSQMGMGNTAQNGLVNAAVANGSLNGSLNNVLNGLHVGPLFL